MSVTVKICGLRDQAAMRAVVDNGAAYAGFVFIPSSRRFIEPAQAAKLALNAQGRVQIVGLFADPTDPELFAAIAEAPLDIIQLHGREKPHRIAEIKKLTGLKIMKAVPIAVENDLIGVEAFEAESDMLLFDTKLGPMPTGGTGQSFEWTILQGKTFAKPWMLAGGLSAGNLAQAVADSGAKIVDVSTGVENPSGEKDPVMIKEFLTCGAQL